MKRDFPTIEPSWIWPDKVSRWVKERAEGHTVYVCSGKSRIGDVLVDRDPRNNPDVEADMDNLPFDDCTFDTAIWDPPWKISCFDRHRPFFELCRVTKPGGKMLCNTTWIPFSQQVQLETPVYLRQDDDKAGFSILSEHTRWPGQSTF